MAEELLVPIHQMAIASWGIFSGLSLSHFQYKDLPPPTLLTWGVGGFLYVAGAIGGSTIYLVFTHFSSTTKDVKNEMPIDTKLIKSNKSVTTSVLVEGRGISALQVANPSQRWWTRVEESKKHRG